MMVGATDVGAIGDVVGIMRMNEDNTTNDRDLIFSPKVKQRCRDR